MNIKLYANEYFYIISIGGGGGGEIAGYSGNAEILLCQNTVTYNIDSTTI